MFLDLRAVPGEQEEHANSAELEPFRYDADVLLSCCPTFENIKQSVPAGVYHTNTHIHSFIKLTWKSFLGRSLDNENTKHNVITSLVYFQKHTC